jgi:glucose-1-phosphate adenylyltransferase
MYNQEWPIHSWIDPLPPAKFIFDEEERIGHAIDSMVSPGSIISGGTVKRSVLSPTVGVDARALVEGSVLMDGVQVGQGAVVRNAILDKQVVVPEGARIGVDPEHDKARGFTVSANGITVIGKGTKVDP